MGILFPVFLIGFAWGLSQGNVQMNWIYFISLGIVWTLVYYFVLHTLVKKFKVAVPGMEINVLHRNYLHVIVRTNVQFVADEMKKLNHNYFEKEVG